MVNKYTYPRVTVSATANQHSSVQPPVPDTTVMFIPIVTKKGPNSVITPVHSLSEFISIFGDLDYTTNGQMALNLYNWLRNGGTAYVYRLAGPKYGNQTKSIIVTKDTVSEWESKPEIIKDSDGNAKIVSSWTMTDLDDANIKDRYLIDSTNSAIIYKDTTGIVSKVYTKKSIVDINLDTFSDDLYYFVSNGAKAKISADGTVTYIKSSTEEDATTRIVPYFDSVDNKPATEGIFYKDCLFIVDPSSKFSLATAIRYTSKKKKSNATETNVIGHAKYYGEHYNNYEVDIDITQKEDLVKNKKLIFTITVYENASNTRLKVESFPRRTKDTYKNSILSSEYLDKDFDLTTILEGLDANTSKIELKLMDADNDGMDTDTVCLPIFWEDEAADVLGNPMETPIDIIFDAGYDLDIKKKMMAFINNVNGQRQDIVGIFDTYSLQKDSTGKLGYLTEPMENIDSEFVAATNIAIYSQYFLISDEIFTSQQIYVTPTYFLTKLIAYNDMHYGIQFPTAGIRRAILDDAEAIYYNPTADAKQDYFTSRINYAEKTPREYAFMNQRTHDNSSEESYTALSFLNNIRVVEKMKKELEKIGRNYLFEFNDSITLSNLSDVLNKYVMNWIANRTLATGIVTVAKNPWSDEAVDVTLTIRFNGTIEVISVEITIE